MEKCPFEVGQKVVFRPDLRMLGAQVMVDNLIVGETYTISAIHRNAYLLLVDHEIVGGGLHWSGFEAA